MPAERSCCCVEDRVVVAMMLQDNDGVKALVEVALVFVVVSVALLEGEFCVGLDVGSSVAEGVLGVLSA